MNKNQFDNFKKREQQKQDFNRDKERPVNPPYQKGREGNTERPEPARGEKNKETYRPGEQAFSEAGQEENYWSSGRPVAAENEDTDEDETEDIENISNRSDADEDNGNRGRGNRTGNKDHEKKNRVNAEQQPSLEDWEGGGSRPQKESRSGSEDKTRKNRKAA